MQQLFESEILFETFVVFSSIASTLLFILFLCCRKQSEYEYDKDGYNRYWYDKYDCNKDGYYKNGYDKFGYSREGYSKRGYDKNGFNVIGYRGVYK